jgi:hypothetical protein
VWWVGVGGRGGRGGRVVVGDLHRCVADRSALTAALTWWIVSLSCWLLSCRKRSNSSLSRGVWSAVRAGNWGWVVVHLVWDTLTCSCSVELSIELPVAGIRAGLLHVPGVTAHGRAGSRWVVGRTGVWLCAAG